MHCKPINIFKRKEKMSTIFAKIIKGEIKAEKVYEDDDILAIKDIAPAAPVHLLIMPKKEIKSLQAVKKEDLFLISKVIVVAQKLAKEFGVEEGYRLLTNVGSGSGQSVFHLHFHLVAGHTLGKIG